MSMRRDAGYAAALTIAFINDLARNSDSSSVATVGSMRFEPNAIGIIPSRAVFTVDLRDPDERSVAHDGGRLAAVILQAGLPMKTGVGEFRSNRCARFEPVRFDRTHRCAWSSKPPRGAPGCIVPTHDRRAPATMLKTIALHGALRL